MKIIAYKIPENRIICTHPITYWWKIIKNYYKEKNNTTLNLDMIYEILEKN